MSEPKADQPERFERYVISVMTPWDASPVPGSVVQHMS